MVHWCAGKISHNRFIRRQQQFSIYRSAVSCCSSLCPYLQSASWSHCKQTTASQSCPDRLTSCYKQMLRSFCVWVGVTAVDRLHVPLHRNSVSMSEMRAAGGANPGTPYRKCSPSAEPTEAKTRTPWLGSLGGSPCAGRGGLPVGCMRLRDSSANTETVHGWSLCTSLPGLARSQPTSESEAGASAARPPPTVRETAAMRGRRHASNMHRPEEDYISII